MQYLFKTRYEDDIRYSYVVGDGGPATLLRGTS